jgi:rubrerythrin
MHDGDQGKTSSNLRTAFVGEAKAIVRNHLFSEIAEKEGYPQIGRLFRAVSEAEGVHARNVLRLLGEVRTTEDNLRFAFESEIRAKNEHYPRYIREAEEEGASTASLAFSRARDVEERHALLYRGALDSLVQEQEFEYFVCQICGYVAERSAPDTCPICMAKRDFFKRV